MPYPKKSFDPNLVTRIQGFKRAGLTYREIAKELDMTAHEIGRVIASKQYKEQLKENSKDIDNTIDTVLKEVELQLLRNYKLVIDVVMEGINSDSAKERIEMVKIFLSEFKSLRTLSLDSRMVEIEDRLEEKLNNGAELV